MDLEFKKYLIKKTSMWSSGSFNIFDEGEVLVYKIKSSVWQMKKKMRMYGVDGDLIYTIEQVSTWPQKFTIDQDGIEIARFEKRNPFSGKQIDVFCKDEEDFFIEGNVWGSNFRFMNKDQEFGIASYNMWSTGDLGLAIKNVYPNELVLSLVICLAYLKISGQI